MKGTIFGSPKSIKSVEEFIATVKERPVEENLELSYPRYLYRGHSDISYSLCPSISREQFSVSLESRLISMARNRRPDEFRTDNKLTLLAKMQHYGLPTRLIDFTTNPLVALYFACQNKEADGEVLVFEEHIYRSGDAVPNYFSLIISDLWNPDNEKSNWDRFMKIISRCYTYEFQTNLILSLVGNVPREGMSVEALYTRISKEPWFIKWDHEKYDGFLDLALQCEILSAMLRFPVFVEAQETIERQRLQQGVYMLIPNTIVYKEKEFLIKSELPDLNVKNSNIGHFIVETEDKTNILKELDMIGINEGFLFADSIDHVCSQIKKDVL